MNRQYNIFRWYRAGWGRYTQVDPLVATVQQPAYAYGFDNPIRFTDPLGLAVRVCCRPLSAGRWVGYHCFIQKNATDTYGLCPSKGSTGTVGLPRHNDPRDEGGDCGPWAASDDCVARFAKKYPIYPYAIRGPNSNTFARCISDACGITPPARANAVDTPGWHSPPLAPFCQRGCGYAPPSGRP